MDSVYIIANRELIKKTIKEFGESEQKADDYKKMFSNIVSTLNKDPEKGFIWEDIFQIIDSI